MNEVSEFWLIVGLRIKYWKEIFKAAFRFKHNTINLVGEIQENWELDAFQHAAVECSDLAMCTYDELCVRSFKRYTPLKCTLGGEFKLVVPTSIGNLVFVGHEITEHKCTRVGVSMPVLVAYVLRLGDGPIETFIGNLAGNCRRWKRTPSNSLGSVIDRMLTGTALTFLLLSALGLLIWYYW